MCITKDRHLREGVPYAVSEGTVEDSEALVGDGVIRWNKPGSLNDCMEQRHHSSHRLTLNWDQTKVNL